MNLLFDKIFDFFLHNFPILFGNNVAFIMKDKILKKLSIVEDS